MVIFPSFTAIDAFGPLNALNLLSIKYPMTLSMVAHDMKPVSIDRAIVDGIYLGNLSTSASPNFTQFVLPTHTFDNAPRPDVIIVPGGMGTRNLTGTQSAVDWVSAQLGDAGEEGWPEYVMSVCTGTSILARTHKIGGKNATTNKAAFNWVKQQDGADEVNWIAKARWVTDGKLWTSSGVSAGTDMLLGWIGERYGAAEQERIMVSMEWNSLGQQDDPFADYYNLTDDKPAARFARIPHPETIEEGMWP